MTLSDMFATLTAKQREALKSIKDITGLEAFLLDSGLTLNAQEKENVLAYLITGKLSLEDDDLNSVAGSAGSGSSYEQMARAEGRPVPVPTAYGFCSCFIEQVWAARHEQDQAGYRNAGTYYDCKCYRCGIQKYKHHISGEPPY